MKKILTTAIVLLSLTIFANPVSESKPKETSEFSVQQNGQNVIICNGKHSKRYHSTSNCDGLSNCKGGLSTVTLQTAQGLGRTACKICYYNSTPLN